MLHVAVSVGSSFSYWPVAIIDGERKYVVKIYHRISRYCRVLEHLRYSIIYKMINSVIMCNAVKKV